MGSRVDNHSQCCRNLRRNIITEKVELLLTLYSPLPSALFLLSKAKASCSSPPPPKSQQKIMSFNIYIYLLPCASTNINFVFVSANKSRPIRFIPFTAFIIETRQGTDIFCIIVSTNESSVFFICCTQFLKFRN